MTPSWMTRGILNLDHTKNMLHSAFIEVNSQNVDVYSQLKEEYTTNKTKLLKRNREAKRLYNLRLLTKLYFENLVLNKCYYK